LVGLIISYFFGSSREIVNIVCYILYIPAGFAIYKYIRPSFLYMMRNTDKGWLGFCIAAVAQKYGGMCSLPLKTESLRPALYCSEMNKHTL
jgi:hypothetical protein